MELVQEVTNIEAQKLSLIELANRIYNCQLELTYNSTMDLPDTDGALLRLKAYKAVMIRKLGTI